MNTDTAWTALLALRDHTRRVGRTRGDLSLRRSDDGSGFDVLTGRARDAILISAEDGGWESAAPPDRGAALLLDLYMPLCRESGPQRRLPADRHVFTDGNAETLVFCGADAVEPAGAGSAAAGAPVVGLPCDQPGGLQPAAICAALAARGIGLLFVEGGGVTVSRFLQAGCLDRLQVTVAPLVIGSGRPAVSLPEIADLSRVLRPRVRHIALGVDVMFDCVFDG